MQDESGEAGQTTFSVRFEGAALPEEVSDRIASSIRRAVLTELAQVDLLKRGLRVENVSSAERIGGGSTQGLVVVANR
jgi:hypothetical protein